MDWLRCSGIRHELKYDFLDGKECNRKLLQYQIVGGEIYVKCPRCGTVNEFHQPINNGVKNE